MFTEALFPTAKRWKPPKCPSTMDKQNVLYTDHGILFSLKEE